MKIQPLIAFGLESTQMLLIIIKEFPIHRGGITNKSFFSYKMQVTNLTPSKDRLLMHHLVACIATSDQYFQNVVPIFCDGYLVLEKILISVNIYFIICGATTFIVWHHHGAKQVKFYPILI